MKWLFDPTNQDSVEDALGDALVTEGRHLAPVGQIVEKWLEAWIGFVVSEILLEIESASRKEARGIAVTVMNARLIGDALAPVVPWERYRKDSYDSVMRLLGGLRG